VQTQAHSQQSKTDQSAVITPHQRQMQSPQSLLELRVEEATTAIVAASNRDLNVIYTPFKRAKVTHNTSEQITIENNKVYFQANGTAPFSIFLTEDDDPSAPQFKIMFVPTDVPVGYQIKLDPVVPYSKAKSKDEIAKGSANGHVESLSKVLVSVGKFLAENENTEHLPEGYRLDDKYVSQPYYIGNVLTQPVMRLIGTHHDVYIVSANNRSNDVLQLSSPDFATMSPATQLLENAQSDTMATAVGMYPRKVLQPGESTNVILVHQINER
jgi:hypothetical protein